MGFMALLAIEVLPLWPLGVFCTQAVGERSVFLTVRLRRRKELLEAILCTGLLWILLYGCLLILAAAVPPLLLGFSPDIGLSVTAVGLKLLDVGFQFPADSVGLMRDGAGNGRICDRCAAAFSFVCCPFHGLPGRAFLSGSG